MGIEGVSRGTLGRAKVTGLRRRTMRSFVKRESRGGPRW